MFVIYRTADIFDVLADSIGGISAIYLHSRFRPDWAEFQFIRTRSA
jgi:hypothetical protein